MKKSALAVAALALFFAFACARSGVEIYAPPELAGGTVMIDGATVAKLSKPLHHYRWRGWKNTRHELSAPPRHESTAVISELAAGRHEISLTKQGYVPLKARLHYKPGHRTIVDLSSVAVQTASGRQGQGRNSW